VDEKDEKDENQVQLTFQLDEDVRMPEKIRQDLSVNLACPKCSKWSVKEKHRFYSIFIKSLSSKTSLSFQLTSSCNSPYLEGLKA